MILCDIAIYVPRLAFEKLIRIGLEKKFMQQWDVQ
jgi:hypothetical protein